MHVLVRSSPYRLGLMDSNAPGTQGNEGSDALGRPGGAGSTVLVVAADPTVRAALAAL